MSNLSNIGFDVNNQEDFVKLCQNVLNTSKTIEVKGGRYFQYSDPSGAELWIQENSKKELIGANPFFQGNSSRNVLITSKHKKGPSEFDGFFMCEALSQDEKKESLYPFIFDIPDAQSLSELKFPFETKIQLSAFAHEIELYTDEKTFEEQRIAKMASRSFIPSGLFFPDGSKKTSPEAFGILVGEVKEAQIRTNSFTNMKFYWMLTETYGGEIDIVSSIDQTDKIPQKGNIISGKFWLTGRIPGLTPRKQGVFQKFFG